MEGDAPGFSLVPDARHSVVVTLDERVDDDLHLDVRVTVHRHAAHAAATATEAQVDAFRRALQVLHAEPRGEAVLVSDGLQLHLTGAAGRVRVTGRVVTPHPGWGEWGEADLRFSLPELDQTFLPSVLAGLDDLLAVPSRPEDD